jgi:hypothetical protein
LQRGVAGQKVIVRLFAADGSYITSGTTTVKVTTSAGDAAGAGSVSHLDTNRWQYLTDADEIDVPDSTVHFSFDNDTTDCLGVTVERSMLPFSPVYGLIQTNRFSDTENDKKVIGTGAAGDQARLEP